MASLDTKLEQRFKYLEDSIGRLNHTMKNLTEMVKAQIRIAEALNDNLVAFSKLVKEEHDRYAGK